MEIEDEITEIQEEMSSALSDNPAVLCKQLSKAESWMSRLTKLLADANSNLSKREYFFLMSIKDDITVREKEITIKNNVANDRRIRDILVGLVDSIKHRLMLGMSLRKSNNAERQDW